jgi:hypothetical protein
LRHGVNRKGAGIATHRLALCSWRGRPPCPHFGNERSKDETALRRIALALRVRRDSGRLLAGLEPGCCARCCRIRPPRSARPSGARSRSLAMPTRRCAPRCSAAPFASPNSSTMPALRASVTVKRCSMAAGRSMVCCCHRRPRSRYGPRSSGSRPTGPSAWSRLANGPASSPRWRLPYCRRTGPAQAGPVARAHFTSSSLISKTSAWFGPIGRGPRSP